MSNMAMLADRLIGGFAYFVEEGVSVDGSAVSASYLPDNTPTDNWPSAGKILNVTPSKEEVADSVNCPRAAGGWGKEDRMIVLADYLDFELKSFNEWVHRMQWGLASAIALDTAYAPFATVDRRIRGGMLLQGRHEGGTDLVRASVYCEARLTTAPSWSPNYGKPVLRVQILESTQNSIVFPS